MTVDFKGLIIKLIEENGIDFNDIANLESTQTIAEATFSPKMAITFKMMNGEQRQITTSLTATFIQDLQAHGVTIEGDIEDLNKFFKRKISLNVLLVNE